MIDSVQKYIQGTTAVKIAVSVEDLVARGRLGPGDRLPPVRRLAEHLGVSPSTVAAAYARLRQRGIAEGQGRHGTRISPRGPAGRLAPVPAAHGLRNLLDGNPDPQLLPDLSPTLNALDPSPHLYGGARHLAALVERARERFEADGIAAHDVLVTAGAMDALERVLRVHLRAGDAVAVEDPGFPGVLDLVAGLGLQLIGVEVDKQGPTPGGLTAALSAGARALVFSPRAQNPTGAALTRPRVRDLSRVLREAGDFLVIEDDHVGDISGAAGRTITTHHRGPWAVVRSTSKSLSPDLRVALVTADESTSARVDAQLGLGTQWVSHLLQQMVADLWSRRAVARRLERARRVYAERRSALITSLAEVDIEAAAPSGLNVWVPVPDEQPVVDALARRGWAILPGERFRLAAAPAVRVTISTLGPREARRFARDLRAVLDARGLTAIA